MILQALKVEARHFSLKFASRMAFRLDYLLSLAIMLFTELTSPLFTVLMYNNSNGFVGWTMWEVLFLQGLFLTIKGISFVFFFGIAWSLRHQIIRGTLDLVLLKPWHPLLMLIFAGADTEDISKPIGGLFLVLLSASHITNITFSNVLLAIALSIISLIFLFGCTLFIATAMIRFYATFRLAELFDVLTLYSKYPRSIYSQKIAAFATWIIPLMIVAYYPAAIILQKSIEGLLPATIATILFTIIGYLLFMNSLKNYTSAGG